VCESLFSRAPARLYEPASHGAHSSECGNGVGVAVVTFTLAVVVVVVVVVVVFALVVLGVGACSAERRVLVRSDRFVLFTTCGTS